MKTEIDFIKSAKNLELYLKDTLGWTTVEHTSYCKKCECRVKTKYCPECGKKSVENNDEYDIVIVELKEALKKSIAYENTVKNPRTKLTTGKSGVK